MQALWRWRPWFHSSRNESQSAIIVSFPSNICATKLLKIGCLSCLYLRSKPRNLNFWHFYGQPGCSWTLRTLNLHFCTRSTIWARWRNWPLRSYIRGKSLGSGFTDGATWPITETTSSAKMKLTLRRKVLNNLCFDRHLWALGPT